MEGFIIKFNKNLLILSVITTLAICLYIFLPFQNTGSATGKESQQSQTNQLQLQENQEVVETQVLQEEVPTETEQPIHTSVNLNEFEEVEETEVYIHGEPKPELTIHEYKENIYTPLEEVAEAMGHELEQAEEGHFELHTEEETAYTIVSGSSVVHKNGIPIMIEEGDFEGNHPAFEKEDKLYIPLDFAESELDYDVQTLENGDINLGKAIVEKPDFPLDVPLINQMADPQLYNGCEVTSMAMILNYHDVHVTKTELANAVPRVPLNYSNGQKGNPNDGFVGDMENGPGLSIYHAPLAETTRNYVGDRVIDFSGSEPEKLFEYLDKGLPVWVIVTSPFAPVNEWETWSTPRGQLDVTFRLHSVVLTGYDETHFYINNPFGHKNQRVAIDSFIGGWQQLGSQAITITE
ncbi:C39 family peptidase [Thalassobacillus hwangdonensis]|uniref:C39 family peptidase n=1 Tax=Thalassobacillus hwangdonensis TaxID=546108 RepID=A0ABW3L2S1_9BACI